MRKTPTEQPRQRQEAPWAEAQAQAPDTPRSWKRRTLQEWQSTSLRRSSHTNFSSISSSSTRVKELDPRSRLSIIPCLQQVTGTLIQGVMFLRARTQALLSIISVLILQTLSPMRVAMHRAMDKDRAKGRGRVMDTSTTSLSRERRPWAHRRIRMLLLWVSLHLLAQATMSTIHILMLMLILLMQDQDREDPGMIALLQQGMIITSSPRLERTEAGVTEMRIMAGTGRRKRFFIKGSSIRGEGRVSM